MTYTKRYARPCMGRRRSIVKIIINLKNKTMRLFEVTYKWNFGLHSQFKFAMFPQDACRNINEEIVSVVELYAHGEKHGKMITGKNLYPFNN
jgi:hypothetical protein